MHRVFLPCLAVLGLVLVASGCSGSSDRDDSPPPSAPLVEALEARFGALPIEETMPMPVTTTRFIGSTSLRPVL